MFAGKAQYQLARGTGRTRVELSAFYLGKDLIVLIYNEVAHLGAAAVAEFAHKEGWASSSVVTLLGHRDDEVAKKAAHQITEQTKKSVCVISGIHVDKITLAEIDEILKVADELVMELIAKLK